MFHRLMFLALAIASASPVFAVERIALVVGINDYENLETLHTAVNDARAVGAALAQHGFTIVETTDPTRREFSRKLAEVVGAVEPGDDLIFFFAGHGVAVDGVNYLLPSDLPELLPGDEGALRDEAFSAADIIDRFKSAGARNTIAILDACRNNPLRSRGRSLGSTRGLARMEVEQGSFILFSADAGQEALNSLPNETGAANSLFTRFLLPYLSDGSLTFPEVARLVRRDVRAAAQTAGADQFPAYYDALADDFRLSAAATTEHAPPPESPTIPSRGRIHALLVGIDDYPNHPLRGAVNDAVDIGRAVTARGASTIRLFDREATSEAFTTAARQIADTAAPGDTVVYTFSGHGWIMNADAYSLLDRGLYVGALVLADDELDVASFRPKVSMYSFVDTAKRYASQGIRFILVVDSNSTLGAVADDLPVETTVVLGSEAGKTLPEVMIDGEPRGAVSWSVARAFVGAADGDGDGEISQQEFLQFVVQSVRDKANMTPDTHPAIGTNLVLLGVGAGAR